MSGMFWYCESLTNIDLSNFNTQNVTNMMGMFYECKSLTNIDLSNFNTQNVTDMGRMFDGCKSLKKENIIVKDDKILNEFSRCH
jgi:surface protein